jgi:hypothetical protein
MRFATQAADELVQRTPQRIASDDHGAEIPAFHQISPRSRRESAGCTFGIRPMAQMAIHRENGSYLALIADRLGSGSRGRDKQEDRPHSDVP